MPISFVQEFPRILLLLLLVAGAASSAFALDFTGNWDYRQSGGEGIDTQNEFRQRYSLGFGKALTYGPSHAISASAAVAYTNTRGGGTGRLTGREEVVPSAQFSLMNDIFRTQLGWSSVVTRQDAMNDQRRSSWSASLASAWNLPLWPNLRLTYDEGAEFLDTASFSGEADRVVRNTGFSVDWDLAVAELFYRYSHSEGETLGSDVVTESDSHFARLETTGDLFGNRIGYRFAQQFQTTRQGIQSDDPSPSVNFVLVPGGITASITDPVLLPEPLPGEGWTDQEIAEEDQKLQGNQVLSDGIIDVDPNLDPDLSLQVDAGDPDDPQNLGDRIHIVFRGLEAGVDRLRLFLDSLSAEQVDQFASLQWDLYVRNPLGVWVRDQENLSVDQGQRSIDLLIPSLVSEIMVVAVNSAGTTMGITEVVGLGVFTGPDNTATSYLTNLGATWRISRTLTASGNLSLDHAETGSRESDRRGVSGVLRWAPVRFVTPSVAFSEQREEQTNAPVRIGRTYGLTVPTHPLPTLNVTFGTTYNEVYLGSLKTNTSNNYSLIFKGPIYPDLTGSWNFTYSESESRDQEGRVFEQSSFSSRLDLQARLYENLIADLVTNYRQSDASSGTDVTLSMRYRPSDLLALRGAYSTGFGDRSGTDQFQLGMNLRLLLTQKAQVTLTADHRQDNQSSQFFALIGSWTINRNLFLRFRGNYTVSERNAYGFQANLGFAL